MQYFPQRTVRLLACLPLSFPFLDMNKHRRVKTYRKTNRLRMKALLIVYKARVLPHCLCKMNSEDESKIRYFEPFVVLVRHIEMARQVNTTSSYSPPTHSDIHVHTCMHRRVFGSCASLVAFVVGVGWLVVTSNS